MDDAFGPGGRFRVLIVTGDEAIDVALQLDNAVERGSFEGVPGQNGEPDFDLIGAGGMRWRVSEMQVRMPRQQHAPLRLVGGRFSRITWIFLP